MTYFESLDFVYRLILERFDFLALFWSIVAFVLSLVVLHWIWGWAWNARWGPFRHPGMAAFGIVMAVCIGGSTLIWLAAGRADAWLQEQSTALTQKYPNDAARIYDIFTTAEQQLGLPPGPVENEMILRSRADLETLAQVAAMHVRCPLTRSGPLGPGAPCQVRNPDEVAQETLQAIPASAYPLTVASGNPWVAYAVTTQVQAALSYARPKLLAGMNELHDVMAALFWIAIGLQVLIVPIAAVADIRVHPQV